MDTPVYYFEPNTVEYEAEDLCLGVALEVQYFDRALNGSKTLTGLVDMPLKPNILGGENNFLTTSYTDIMVLELEGGGDKESIGIESIDIKYNSWYLPEVNIKFVDIRGNSVFNPMELTNNAESRDRAKGSFLKGFFMFPYPIFILTVKGYFGKPITFRLTVKGVPQAQLNAQTGNFEITVGFIGHMYYYLTDIPMSLLLIAPYINYGGVDSTLISYENGVRVKTLPTFVDFVKNTSDAMKKIAQDQIFSDVIMKKTEVETILEQIVILTKNLEEVQFNIDSFWTNEGVVEDNKTLFKINKDACIKEGEEVDNVITNLFQNLLPNIKNTCEKLNKDYTITLIITQNDFLYDIESIKSGSGIKLQVDFATDIETLTTTKTSLTEELSDIEEERTELFNSVFEKQYGIIPTIKNVFDITFAHLNKLHENVRACINDINNERSTRDLSKIKEETDINTTTKNITTYPFTGFFSKNNKEEIWIGETSAAKYSETKFINKVFDGMNTYNKQMLGAEEEYLLNNHFSVNLPPSGLFSTLNDIGNKNEYYTKLHDSYKGNLCDFCLSNDGLPPALQFFAERYVDAILSMKDSKYLKEDFPKVEAYKLLSCGWDERVYNSNTIWGNDETIPYGVNFKEHFENAISKKLASIESTYPLTLVANRVYYKKIGSEVKRTYTIEERTFSSLGFKQYYEESYSILDVHRVGGTPALSKQYHKFPTKAIDLTFVLEKKLNQSNDYVENNGVNSSVNFFKKNDIIDTETLVNKDSIMDFKNNTMSYTNDIDFFKNLPLNDENTEDIKKIMNQGGIISFPKLFLMRGVAKYINSGYQKKFYEPTKVKNGIALTEGKIDDEAPTHNYRVLFFTQDIFKDFYEKNKNVLMERVKTLMETYNDVDVLYDNFKNILNEKIDLVFPYYLENGVFSFSIGKSHEEKLLNPTQLSSEEINKNYMQEFYADANAVKIFIDTIRKYIKPQVKEQEEIKKDYNKEANEIKETNAKKIAIYDIFKNLYDRWKFGAEDFKSTYNNNLSCVSIENVIFRDALNRDISNKLEVNINKLIEHIFTIYKGEKDMSLYEFLFEICSDINCLLLALPLNSFEAIKSNNDMKRMFTPFQYSSVINNPISSTFVVTYRQKDSQHLNYHPNESAYKDDGIEFTNYISSSENGGENGLGVFGVTYGMGKQSYFKNIISSMEKPKVTEQSIASTLSIAEQGAKNSSQNYGMSTHDVFDTYSQHSYHCSVETMGNMQIMPMMYFQLNNIPLFKGGYFITSVEHTINKDGMKTTFKGNRLSQNQIQLLRSGKFEINIDNSYNTPNTGSESVSDTNVRSYPTLTYTKENTLIVVYAGRAMSDPYYESPDLSKDPVFLFTKGNTEEEEYILTPHDSNNQPVDKKYREYWGNRKIAMSLVSKLQEAGYAVETAFYNDRSAQEKAFQTSYTQNWGGVERNTIGICIYSDEITNIDENGNITAPTWGTNKQWVIYKQNKDGEYDPATRQFIQKPYHLVSDKLAQCIASKMSTALSGNASIVVNPTPQVNESKVAWKGITDFEMPSVLSKNLFHTTKAHVHFLAKKENRQLIAQAHFDGIEQFFKDMEGKNSRMLIISENEVMLSQYFSYSELTRTDEIDPETKEKMINIPNDAEEQNLITLATTILDKVREKYGKAIWVESGFRCEKVNNAVGGVATSQHRTGSAADLYAMNRIHNAPIFWAAYDLIQSGEITVGQLIWEYGDKKQPAWVHISLPNRESGIINQFLRYYRDSNNVKRSKPFNVDEYVRVDN